CLVKADFRRQFFQLIIRQQNLTLDHRDVVHYLLLTPGWGPAFFGRRLKQVIGQFNFQAVQLTDQPRPLFLSFPELRVFHQRLLFHFLSDVTRRVVDEMLVQQFLDGILLSPAPTNQLHDPLRPEFLGGAVGVNRRSLPVPCHPGSGTTPRCSPRDRTPRSIGPVAADSLRLAPRFVWPSRSAPVSFAADPPTKSGSGTARGRSARPPPENCSCLSSAFGARRASPY